MQSLSPRATWQSLANVQPATFWEPVLLPDTSDSYRLLRHQLRTLRSAPGMIMVEDQKNHQLQFWHLCVWPYLNLCPAWRSASQSHAVPNLCRNQSLKEGRVQPAIKKSVQKLWPEQEGSACPGPGGHWDSSRLTASA